MSSGPEEHPQRYEAIHPIPAQTTRVEPRGGGPPAIFSRVEWDPPPRGDDASELDKLRYAAGLTELDINCLIEISIHNGHYVLHFSRRADAAQGVGGSNSYDGGFDFDQAMAFLAGMRELARMIRMRSLPTIGQVPDLIPAPIRKWLDENPDR